MKRFPILFTLLLMAGSVAFGQSVPRLAKYTVGTTGCAVYLPSDPGEFEMSLSEDDSQIFTGESKHGDHFFAVIVVQLSEPIGDAEEDKYDMMTAYLDFLQEQFSVTGAAGYGKGHTLESAPKAVGVIDYWEDAEGTQYAIKSWCDGNFLSVLLLYGPEDYPIYNVQDMFLNGFRFPAE